MNCVGAEQVELRVNNASSRRILSTEGLSSQWTLSWQPGPHAAAVATLYTTLNGTGSDGRRETAVAEAMG